MILPETGEGFQQLANGELPATWLPIVELTAGSTGSPVRTFPSVDKLQWLHTMLKRSSIGSKNGPPLTYSRVRHVRSTARERPSNVLSTSHRHWPCQCPTDVMPSSLISSTSLKTPSLQIDISHVGCCRLQSFTPTLAASHWLGTAESHFSTTAVPFR